MGLPRAVLEWLQQHMPHSGFEINRRFLDMGLPDVFWLPIRVKVIGRSTGSRAKESSKVRPFEKKIGAAFMARLNVLKARGASERQLKSTGNK